MGRTGRRGSSSCCVTGGRRRKARRSESDELLRVYAPDQAPAVEQVDLRGAVGNEANLLQQRLERKVGLPAESGADRSDQILEAPDRGALAPEVVEHHDVAARLDHPLHLA